MHIQVQQSHATLRRASDQSGPGLHRLSMPQALRRSERERAADAPFEIRNVSGKTAFGVEIELAGFGEEGVFHAYYLNRYGAPQVSRAIGVIRLRFESLYRMPVAALSQVGVVRRQAPARISQPFVWECALIGACSERFCLELSTTDVVASYRWLVAGEAGAGVLVADSSTAHVRNPG